MTRQLIAIMLWLPAVSLYGCGSSSPPPIFTNTGGTGASTVGTGAAPSEATGCQAGQIDQADPIIFSDLFIISRIRKA